MALSIAPQKPFERNVDAELAKSQKNLMNLDLVKAFSKDMSRILPGSLVVGVNAIELETQRQNIPSSRRKTIDADFYSQVQITDKRLAMLEESGYKLYSKHTEDRFDRNSKVNFFKKRVDGLEYPVDILQLNAFDCEIKTPGYQIKMVNTQNVIKGQNVSDGIWIPSMAFVAMIKTPAHIQRYIAPESERLYTDKHGTDVAFILEKLEKKTPEEFHDAYKPMLRQVLRDKESMKTHLKVMKEIYEEFGRK